MLLIDICGTRLIPLTTCPQTEMFGWQSLMAEGQCIPSLFPVAALGIPGWIRSCGGRSKSIPHTGRNGRKNVQLRILNDRTKWKAPPGLCLMRQPCSNHPATSYKRNIIQGSKLAIDRVCFCSPKDIPQSPRLMEALAFSRTLQSIW